MTALDGSIRQAAAEAAAKRKIFIGLPNMKTINDQLSRKLFHYALQKNCQTFIEWQSSTMHHDFARNVLVRKFLGTDAEWMCMIDSDVDPHPDLMKLADYGKPVIAATVFAWIKDGLRPSIWVRADCEQCKAVEEFRRDGRITDPSQYRIDNDGVMMRWNPFSNFWQRYCDRERGVFETLRCRCSSSGKDPFVYRVHPEVVSPERIIRVDAVGAAAVLIHRSTFEKIPPPWFRFLYKEDGEILLTEDLYFCWRASHYGISVWADNQMPCGHWKNVDLLTINNYINQCYEMGKQEGKREIAASEPRKIILPSNVEVISSLKSKRV